MTNDTGDKQVAGSSNTAKDFKSVKIGFYAQRTVYDWWIAQPPLNRSKALNAIILRSIAPDHDPINALEKRADNLETGQDLLIERVRKIEQKLDCDSF
jgi:hypothetical protein